MTVKFGCFHTVFENKKATEFILQEFRKFHPDAPYTLCCDGGVDYSDLAEEYNCNYVHSYMRIGRRNSGHESGISGLPIGCNLLTSFIFKNLVVLVPLAL